MTDNSDSKKRIRERMLREGINYSEAKRRDAAEHAATSSPLLPPPPTAGHSSRQQVLRNLVDDWCANQAYTDIDSLPGVDVDELELHQDLEEATVSELVPDLDSIDTQVVEAYEHGALALGGSARATLRVEGFMPRAQAYIAIEEDAIEVLDIDFNDHYAEVQDPTEAVLEIDFTAVADTDDETSVEGFEVVGLRLVDR